jgi:CHAT domain-containing protein/Tfp pilus assembly protein PilF
MEKASLSISPDMKFFLLSLVLLLTVSEGIAQHTQDIGQAADSLVSSGQYEAAISLLKPLIAGDEASKNPREAVKIHLKLSVAQSYVLPFEAYLKTMEEAERIARRGLPVRDSLLGKVLFNKGELLLEVGNIEEAETAYLEAFPILENHGLWEDAIFAKVGIAVCQYYQENFREMEAELKLAESLQEAHLPNDDTLPPIIYNLLSVAYDFYGNYDGALSVALKALNMQIRHIATNPADSFLLSPYYNNVGAFYYSKGDYEQATLYYQNAIAVNQRFQKNEKSLASTYNNLALSYIRAGQLENALKALDQSQQLLVGLPDEEIAAELSILYNSIARSYLLEGRGEKAMEFARQALELKEQAPQYTYLSLQRLAEGHLEQNQPALAIPVLKEALVQKKKNPQLLDAVLYKLLSRAELLTGQAEPALKSSQRALELLYPQLPTDAFYPNPTGLQPVNRLESIQILQQKAQALAAYGRGKKSEPEYLDHALATYVFSFEWNNEARKEYLNARSKQLLIKSTRLAHEQAIRVALRQYELVENNSYLEMAFELAEQDKAVILQERFQDNRAKLFAHIPDTLRQKEIELKRDLAFYKQQLTEAQFVEDAEQAKIDFWNAKVLSLTRRLDALNQQYEKQFPVYYQLKYEIPEISVAAIRQNILTDSSLLIEFFVGEENIFVFSIHKQGIRLKAISRTETLEKEVMALRQCLSTPPLGSASEHFQQYTRYASALYKELLHEVLRNYPTASQLLLVPDQFLSYLPYEVLLMQEAPSSEVPSYSSLPYLMNRFQVGYSYSARLLLSLIEMDHHLLARPRCLAFAPNFAGTQSGNRDFGTITGNRKELDLIRQYFKGKYLFGNDAVEAAFKQDGPGYDIIHLATHGIADEQSPLFSRIAFQPVSGLGEDNLLHTFELYEMLLNARLVVLSACETGLGKFAYGEEVLSLASGFMHTGCRNVTQSLWEAQDQSTAQIMKRYYEYISEGYPVRAALQKAKIAYLQDPLAQKHPFYWAAFINIGDGHAFVKPASSIPYWLLAIIGGLLAIGFAYWRFRS